MDASTSSESAAVTANRTIKMENIVIPTQLKFLMGNIKFVINIQLTSDNYPLWWSQLMKLFTTNGFNGYLDWTTLKPPRKISDSNGAILDNSNFFIWLLIDMNLSVIAACLKFRLLCQYLAYHRTPSSIFKSFSRPTIEKQTIPYHDEGGKYDAIPIWNLGQMWCNRCHKNSSSTRGYYLLHSQWFVAHLPGVQDFYTHKFTIPSFWWLLCPSLQRRDQSVVESQKEIVAQPPTYHQFALSLCSRGRGRSYNKHYVGHGCTSQFPSKIDKAEWNFNHGKQTTPYIECQICGKLGHFAYKCWYRADLSYKPSPQT